ncbi:hypothetical protein EG833_01955 [archaeon]|nr:hypothetical protein [archaeon]
MKRYIVVLFFTILIVLQFSQPASARTNVAVNFAIPGLCLDVSNARPAPRPVWVDGCRGWNNRTHVWAPGHWRYAPAREVVYVVPRHERHCDRYHRPQYNERYDRHDSYDREDRNDRDTSRRGR